MLKREVEGWSSLYIVEVVAYLLVYIVERLIFQNIQLLLEVFYTMAAQLHAAWHFVAQLTCALFFHQFAEAIVVRIVGKTYDRSTRTHANLVYSADSLFVRSVVNLIVAFCYHQQYVRIAHNREVDRRVVA